ncbi:MAG: hypothetical protein ABIQ65_01305, partial [Thermoanaerobaculia bacterium]
FPDDPDVRSRRAEVRQLARFLEGAALGTLPDARSVGDRVFSSRSVAGFDPAGEAAGLYPAKDADELRRRVRLLALRLLSLLDGPAAVAIPASPRAGEVTRLLEGGAPRRSPR